MSFNRPQGTRNPPTTNTRSSGGWGDSTRPSGLAAGLPAATSARGTDGPERRAEPVRKTEEAWKSAEEPREPRGWGQPRSSTGWGSARRDEAAVEEVDDKFARSFGKVSTGPAAAPAPSSSFGRGPAPSEDRRDNRDREGERGFGGGFRDRDGGRDGERGFGGGGFRDRERGSRNADADVHAVDDKFSRAFGKRPDSAAGPAGGAGGAPRERRDDYPRRDLEPFGSGGPGRSFGGGDRDRDNRGAGGGERSFGGDRGGERSFGGGGGERSFGGRSGDARSGPRGGGRRDDDWADDPRFAGKFTSGDARAGGGERGARGDARTDRGDRDRGDYRNRGGREIDPSRFEGPLPTAPRAALAASVDPAREEEEAKKAEQLRLQKEDEEKRVKAEKEAAKAARKKAEEDAKKAKEEAKKAEEAAKNATLSAFDRAISITAEAIASGLKGTELTAHLQKELAAPIMPAGVLKSILASLKDDYTSVAWYADAHFGHALKNLFDTNVPAQVSLLYAVQAFCDEKKFPKIKTKSGAEKRLIEVLISILLNAQIVDVDGLLAWADDDNKLNIAGRTNAIVQTTEMITKLREALLEEEEEEDYDDEDFKQQYVK